jgi:hypothetical protein
MKKLLLSICILITMTSYSQISKEIQGVWKGENSSYYVLVVANKEERLQFANVSWEQGNILKEEILEKEKEHIITQIYNPENDWWVSIKYTMVDKNTVRCEFSGDSDNVSIYKRQYITN